MAMKAVHFSNTELRQLRIKNGVPVPAEAVDMDANGIVLPLDTVLLTPADGVPGFDAAHSHLVVDPVSARLELIAPPPPAMPRKMHRVA